MSSGGEPPGFVRIIAEAGVNHNGDESLAHDLVDVAADAGADAVKFQTFQPALVVSATAATAPYQRERLGLDRQVDMIRALELPADAWRRLRDHATERGVAFLSSPFDLPSAELLIDVGTEELKIASGELTNLPFLRAVARLGVPLILSTGMASEAEVGVALAAVQDAPGVTLLHCVSAYPAPVDQANLRAIPAMARAFSVPVGWSDHTLTDVTAIVAVALGASVLEKHITTDRSLPGPDHAASLDPAQLAQYVDVVRAASASLGDGIKRRQPVEEEVAPLVRRSWHAARTLEIGTVIDGSDDIVCLRPELGLVPSVSLAGGRVLRAIKAGDPIRAEDVDLT